MSTKLHPIVAKIAKVYSKAKPYDGYHAQRRGYLEPKDWCESPGIGVTPDTLDRAIGLLDRLLWRLEEHGFTVSIDKERRLTVEINGVTFKLSLYEPYHRRKHMPTKAEREKMARNPHLHGVPRSDYLPTGMLRLTANDYHKWNDKPSCTADELAQELVERMIRTANQVKAQREKDERQRLEWKQQEEQRRKEEERQRDEEAKLTQLMKAARDWNQASIVRAYVADVRARLGPVELGGELEKWLNWADHCAKLLDPIEPYRMRIDNSGRPDAGCPPGSPQEEKFKE